MKSDILEKVYNRLANEMIKLEEWKNIMNYMKND